MPKFRIVTSKRYKSLDDLCDELIARKRTIKINEIVDMVQDFSKQNDGIFDDIIISDDRNHSNKKFFDSRFPSNPHNKEFSGINYHSAANPRGVFPASLNQLCKFLKMAYTLRVGSQVLEEMKETTAAPRWRIVEAKNHGGLDDWFKKEKWVDVSRPKKKGKGYEPCGRGDTSKGKKPVCTPANKAKNLSEKERKNRIRQKRKKERDPNPDKKPNVTKYTEQAGGKSNVSDSHNIRFIGSMIPLSELKPKQPKFIKVSGIEDEGGLGSDNPDNPLTEMGYGKRNYGEEPSPDDKETWKPFFFDFYFPAYKRTVSNILDPMLEDSIYSGLGQFRVALNRREPDAIKLFLNANEYLAGTSKSRGFSIMAQIACIKMAQNAEKFLNAGIDIFNFDNPESSDVQNAWDYLTSGTFLDEEEEDDQIQ